jgi:hypothetical protein
MTTRTKIKTEPVRAKILTDEYEIEGNVQIRVGRSQPRVTDVLNAPESEFIPVTQARCTSRNAIDPVPVETDCTIVQVKTIKMIFPSEE